MNRIKILITILSLFLVSACAAPLMIFSGSAGAGATLSKDQTVGSSIDDKTIWMKIKSSFLKNNKEVEGILSDVSIEVSEGRVLLTGFVATADDRLKALKLVWEQSGVREVINEIKLRDNKSKSGSYTSDLWITTRVKSKMLLAKGIHSINYSVETINGTVYVLGVTSDVEEVEIIRSIVNKIKNVNKVITYIRVRGRQEDDAKIENSEDEEIVDKSAQNEPESVNSEEKYIEPEEKKSTPKKQKEVSKTEILDEEEMEIEYSDSE